MPSRAPPPESNDGRDGGASAGRGSAAVDAVPSRTLPPEIGVAVGWAAMRAWGSAVTVAAVPEGTSPALAAAAAGCLKLV